MKSVLPTWRRSQGEESAVLLAAAPLEGRLSSWVPVPAIVVTSPVASVTDSDGVVARVGHVERLAVGGEGEALGLTEGRFVGVTVFEAGLAAADGLEEPAVHVGHEDAVVGGIRDEEAAALGVGQHFAGVGEHGAGDGVRFESEGYGRAVDLLFGVEFVDEGRDDRCEEVVDALAGMAADEVACRVDEDEGRPCIGAVGVPEGEVGVVHDGMMEAVLLNSVADALVVVLCGVLAGVDADDDEGLAEVGFEV